MSDHFASTLADGHGHAVRVPVNHSPVRSARFSQLRVAEPNLLADAASKQQLRQCLFLLTDASVTLFRSDCRSSSRIISVRTPIIIPAATGTCLSLSHSQRLYSRASGRSSGAWQSKAGGSAPLHAVCARMSTARQCSRIRQARRCR